MPDNETGPAAPHAELQGPIRLIKSPTTPIHIPSDNRPHILLIVDQLTQTLGGGERVLLRIAALLPDYGFRVSILTFQADTQSPALTSEPPCPIYLLPLRRTWDWNAFKAARGLRRFLKQRDVRLVQTFFESSDLWAGAVAKTVAGMKLIWSRRDMGILRDQKHCAAYKLLAKMPDRVFTVSDQVRKHCIEVDGIPTENVQTIYNGVEVGNSTSVRTDLSPERDEFLIACVGNIRRVKGHDVLVEAAALTLKSFPNVSFAIAGEILDRNYFQALQRRIVELGLGDKFRFAGGIEDLASWLAEAQMFVLPSRSEGFSNAIVEAMAAGLPVIATNVGGNAEAVEDGVTGTIVPPENPTALAEAICRILSTPETLQQMGEMGRRRALHAFTTSAMLDQTVDAYRRLLR